jgi:uncharacterized protein YdaU (DUF1376 family)
VHYYKRNIGDYAKKAGRLSMLQHGAYTLLIDTCYDREQFPTLDEAIEWTWASTKEEIEAVEFVLRKFYVFEGGVYVQKRISEEVAEYHAKSETNKRIANERETKRKENGTKREQVVNEPPPNHKPITNNQEPIIKALVASEAGQPYCPHDKIIALYHEHLPILPAVKVWNDKRKQALQARWREGESRQNLDYWKDLFIYVSASDFLCGRASTFHATLEWLVNSTNFVKVIEGNYENRKAAA